MTTYLAQELRQLKALVEEGLFTQEDYNMFAKFVGMTTYLENLPNDLIDLIYQKKHKMEMKVNWDIMFRGDFLNAENGCTSTEYFDQMNSHSSSRKQVIRTKNNKQLNHWNWVDGNYYNCFWQIEEDEQYEALNPMRLSQETHNILVALLAEADAAEA